MLYAKKYVARQDCYLLVIIKIMKCVVQKKVSVPKRLIDSKAWCPLSFLLEIVSLQWEHKTKTLRIA